MLKVAKQDFHSVYGYYEDLKNENVREIKKRKREREKIKIGELNTLLIE